MKKKTTKELIKEYEALFDLIENHECFSSSDLLRYYAIERELIRRGCKITLIPKVILPK